MKRSEYQEKLRHDEFLQKYADFVSADDEPGWLKFTMLVILIGFGFVAAIYLIEWLTRAAQ